MQIPYSIKDVRRASQRKLFSVISTFAGGGGSSTGYKLAGGDVLAVNEFIESAQETYAANYPLTKIIPDDIRSLSGKDFLRVAGLKEGELDILDGSPPCASFSMSGTREKSWGKEKRYSNKTQRVDDLFFEFVRILKEIQPKIFVAENVKGLIIGAAKNVLGFRAKTLFPDESPTIIKSFQAAGYDVAWRILNAANYGVPQRRERIIIIGVRKDLGFTPVFPKRTVRKWISFGEAMQNLPEIEWTEENKKYLYISNTTTGDKYFLQLSPGQRICTLHPKGHYFNFYRLSSHKISPTILQSGFREIMHPSEDRMISIEECKRIMGFPDDFKLLGTFKQKWERLGRAVCPLMYEAVANNLYEKILKKI